MHLCVESVTKRFGTNVALNDVSFNVGSDEFVCLLGPSGCGKTTLLRLIAGLTSLDSGRLLLEGVDLARVPARERGFGIVFQSYSLFPSMTVADNVAFGLSVRRVEQNTIRDRVAQLLDLVGLAAMAERYPWQLSGGQQQRVAIARAIAVQPRLLLLDEPLSALDAKVRAQLREEIKQLQRTLGIPTIMVTHDQEEALLLADRIVCMNQGVVAQIGTPSELYRVPANRFVADFMGTSNIVTPAVFAHISQRDLPSPMDEDSLICVRPEDVVLATDGTDGTIQDIHFLGDKSRLKVQLPSATIWSTQLGATPFHIGDQVGVRIASDACVVLASE